MARQRRKGERAAMRECNNIANIRTSGMIHKDYYELSFRLTFVKITLARLLSLSLVMPSTTSAKRQKRIGQNKKLTMKEAIR